MRKLHSSNFTHKYKRRSSGRSNAPELFWCHSGLDHGNLFVGRPHNFLDSFSFMWHPCNTDRNPLNIKITKIHAFTKKNDPRMRQNPKINHFTSRLIRVFLFEKSIINKLLCQCIAFTFKKDYNAKHKNLFEIVFRDCGSN